MAPSSEERREVARMLREVTDGERAAMFLEEILCGILGDRYCRDGEFQISDKLILLRLADLIEPQEITEDTSDGYHTFGQLYYQRMMLFAVLVKEHKEHSWKTRRHEDGEPCFGGGWFLVTIETPDGPYGYHYEDKYWDLFDCDEIPKAKPWDGYDESDVGRLMSLISKGDGAKNAD